MMKVLVSDYDRTLYRDDEEIKLNVENVVQFGIRLELQIGCQQVIKEMAEFTDNVVVKIYK